MGGTLSSPSLLLCCLHVGLRPSFSPGACLGFLGTLAPPTLLKTLRDPLVTELRGLCR